MRARGLALFFLLLLPLASSAQPAGQKSVIHKVTDKGESYEDLAEHYYGKRYLAAHLRSFNKRPEPLSKNTTILIPTFSLVAVKPKQTLKEFAEANLADPGRAEYLAELHDLRGKERIAPRPGTRLKVVQSLKHLVRPGESLKTIARLYYRDAGGDRVKLLVLYNKLASANVRPGMAIRIPLDSSEFNQAIVAARAKRPFERASAQQIAASTVPEDRRPSVTASAKRKASPVELDPIRVEPGEKKAPELDQALEELDRMCGDGDYEGCEVEAKKVFDAAAAAPAPTRVEILRLRAYALIALGRVEESKESFRLILKLDPEYDLDLYRTSPKILDVFQAVAER